jgi:hypothetical protein
VIELNDSEIREVVRPKDEQYAVYEAACGAQMLEEDRIAT